MGSPSLPSPGDPKIFPCPCPGGPSLRTAPACSEAPLLSWAESGRINNQTRPPRALLGWTQQEGPV